MQLQPGLVRSVGILGGLSDETLTFLLQRAARVDVPRGQAFLGEGELCTSFFSPGAGHSPSHQEG